jgi:hypothetical protein
VLSRPNARRNFHQYTVYDSGERNSNSMKRERVRIRDLPSRKERVSRSSSGLCWAVDETPVPTDARHAVGSTQQSRLDMPSASAYVAIQLSGQILKAWFSRSLINAPTALIIIRKSYSTLNSEIEKGLENDFNET